MTMFYLLASVGTDSWKGVLHSMLYHELVGITLFDGS
jgi:hypothetical protein